MKIVAVNSRRFSVDELTRAIAGSKNTQQPMELIVDNGGYFSVVQGWTTTAACAIRISSASRAPKTC